MESSKGDSLVSSTKTSDNHRMFCFRPRRHSQNILKSSLSLSFNTSYISSVVYILSGLRSVCLPSLFKLRCWATAMEQLMFLQFCSFHISINTLLFRGANAYTVLCAAASRLALEQLSRVQTHECWTSDCKCCFTWLE